MEGRDDEKKSTTSLWLDGLSGLKEEDFRAQIPPKNWVQFAAFSVVFKLKSTVFQTTVVSALKQMTNQIHRYLMETGIPNIKILAGMNPDVKLTGKQVVTVLYGYAIDNPENNPVLPVKIFRPVAENMTQVCKQMGVASWKYAGLLENSDLVHSSLKNQVEQPFAIVQGLDPTKNEYKWFDRTYQVLKSETVYREFPKDVVAPV
ncbi:MAG: hypothetical protein ACW96N_08310 [Candidatus Thorarchaeota archaeon]|jgi:hypothetical protein